MSLSRESAHLLFTAVGRPVYGKMFRHKALGFVHKTVSVVGGLAFVVCV
jgi:hypothetical protein